MVLLVAALQAGEDARRLLGRNLRHLDLLEAARQRLVALEALPEVLPGGGADAAQLAVLERRLEQVRGVEGAASGAAGADQGVDLVDEEDGALLRRQRRQHRLEPVLEVAAIASAGEEGAEVEAIDARAAEGRRHLALLDLRRQPFDQGRLADAGVADVDRVVLAPPLEDVQGALHLPLAPDQRVDGAAPRQLVQVVGESGQGLGAGAPGGADPQQA